jgi:hypothetical protein
MKNAQVSSLGRFRSTRGIVSTPKPKTSGYVQVGIHKKSYLFHRLVATAFALPFQPGQTQVDHINGDRSDNRVVNLRYATPSQNVRHSYKTNSARASNAPRQSKPILGRKVGADDWTTFPSANEAARTLRLDHGHISACANRRQLSTGGFEFKFAEAAEVDTLDGEMWKSTVGGAQVSSLGRFRSTRGIVSTPKPRTSGYVQVKIHKKIYLLHRLVATAFALPFQPGQTQVDHINGDPSDNRVVNLRYATPSQNVRHSYKTNSARASNASRLSKPILGRKVGEDDWTTFPSSREAARTLRLDQRHISACANRRQLSTGGFEFKFAEAAEVDTLDGEVWMDVVLPQQKLCGGVVG